MLERQEAHSGGALIKNLGQVARRTAQLGDDPTPVARSGHSPSLTQPDEPLGYVKAYCISVPVVMPVCVSQLKKNSFPESLNHKRTTHTTLNWTTLKYIRINST